jgi:alcohol dehydrogenase class IV
MTTQAAQDNETYRLAFPGTKYPHISYGLPFSEACAKHIATTFYASRVYLIASGSLAKNTGNVTDLQQVLGKRLAGTRVGMTSHTLWSQVLEVVDDCKKLDVDLIVTLGAGSLTDAAKIIALVPTPFLSATISQLD